MGTAPRSAQESSAAPAACNGRQHLRFPSDVGEVGLELAVNAMVVNESYGGLCLEIPSLPALAPKAVVRIQYQGAPMDAIVRWIEQSESGEYRLGLEWKT